MRGRTIGDTAAGGSGVSLHAQVIASALVGGAPRLEPDGSSLDPLLGALAGRAAPQRMLDAIALITGYTDAGMEPLPAIVLPQPCAGDPRPMCGVAASGHCTELLKDRRALLREWLALLNARNLRLPEELLPALLDAATADRSLRASAGMAAGARGVWLAQVRPEWSWTRPAGELAWETGTQAERAAFLERVRGSDPARARDLVLSAWAEESADGRQQFVAALAVGLGPEDEEFLERALDDRSVTVRRASANLLGSLAGSRLSQRMMDRLEGRIRLGKTGLLGRKRTVEVTPFEEADAAMARDGVEKKPPADVTVGERAWWTEQTIACVPPAHWVRLLGATEQQLVEAARNGEWAALLEEGWLRAAIRHGAQEWLVALAADATPGLTATASLFRAMEAGAREATLTPLLVKEPKAWLPHVAVYCDHPWSEVFTRTVLKLAAGSATGGPEEGWSYQLRMLLRASALLASSEVEVLPEDEIFAEFIEVLSFRRRMRQALRNQEN
ncbi:MAG: DUF5691 domain-containing protein [Paludibaculum sp.]